MSIEANVISAQVALEKPWHRLAVKLHMQGFPIGEIAQDLNQSVEAVSALMSSPLARQRIAEMILDDKSRVDSLLEAASLDSILRLIHLRDSAESQAVQLNAAKCLIEHGIGRPVTKIISEVSDTRKLDPKEEAEQLKRELNISNG